MPKFALYDPKAPSPQPVVGWYDTDNFEHAKLPAKDKLILVLPEVWKQRLDDPAGFVVVDGSVQHKDD